MLTLERVNLTADDRGASVECEDVTDEWLCLTLDFDYVCDLNNGILLGLREFPFFSRAFNIEGEDSKRGDFGIVPVALLAFYGIKVFNIDLILSVAQFIGCGSHLIGTGLDLNPAHAHN